MVTLSPKPFFLVPLLQPSGAPLGPTDRLPRRRYADDSYGGKAWVQWARGGAQAEDERRSGHGVRGGRPGGEEDTGQLRERVPLPTTTNVSDPFRGGATAGTGSWFALATKGCSPA